MLKLDIDFYLELIDKILNDKIHLVEACREVSHYDLQEAGIPLEKFAYIIGFESQTDHYPLGEVRKKLDPKALKELDDDINQFIQEAKPGVKESCLDLREELLKLKTVR